MGLIDPDLLWPIGGAIFAGALIGVEREYRSSPAGFRTHILVSLSSALLMLAAVHQVRWLSDTPSDIIRIDPVRMAHGILTGIGFLCGGVIFREGFSVRGLTTAASLWSTASLGTLFGVGFYGLALLGTLATLAILGAVRMAGTILPQRQYADIRIRYRPEATADLSTFRRLLSEHSLSPQAINQLQDLDGLAFEATVGGYREDRAQDLAKALRVNPDVVAFQSLPHKL